MANQSRLHFGIALKPLGDRFSGEFLAQLQSVIEALPGNRPVAGGVRNLPAWQLHGSVAALHDSDCFSGTTVTVAPSVIALYFTGSTYEEHEALLIHWICDHQPCRLQDLDYGTDITEPAALARWMKGYGIGDSQIQVRARQALHQSLIGALCTRLQWDDWGCLSLFFQSSNTQAQRLSFFAENLLLGDNLQDLEAEQAALLQAHAACGSAVLSIHFSPERCLHITFEEALILKISADQAQSGGDNAWSLDIHQGDGGWTPWVWIRRGGDLVCSDRCPLQD